jgi:SAM-dependent methyltransferase
MTPETPRPAAERFTQAVLRGEQRAEEWWDQRAREIGTVKRPVLDLGCGTGDLLAVLASRGIPAIGVDVAFRWLAQARRRSRLRGGAQRLVCCNAEYLPFAPNSFSTVSAMNMLEHAGDALGVVRETHRVLEDGGVLYIRTVNRFSILPEPHVQVWGVGLLPRSWADAYVRWRTGQRYLHHRPLSAPELERNLQKAGFLDVRVTAATPLPHEYDRIPPRFRFLIGLYNRSRSNRMFGRLLALVAPLLDGMGRHARSSHTNGSPPE